MTPIQRVITYTTTVYTYITKDVQEVVRKSRNIKYTARLLDGLAVGVIVVISSTRGLPTATSQSTNLVVYFLRRFLPTTSSTTSPSHHYAAFSLCDGVSEWSLCDGAVDGPTSYLVESR
jgi:hypothetical protein